MSLGVGAPIAYGQTIPTTDIAQMVGQVQGALQQRFDINTAKVEEMIQNVSSIPLLRDKDKQYLGEKLQGLLNTVNANLKVSGGKGLLNNTVTNEINKYITTAIDDNVKKQMKNSQAIINFNKGVEELKGKKDGGYDPGNYSYALDKAGYSAYMNGETDDIGALEYNPYVDYRATTLEKATKLKALKGDQEIEMPDPNDPRYMVKRKVSGLTPQEIIQYFPEMLTPQEEKQMAIEGWGQFRGAPKEIVAQQADAFFQTRKKAVEEAIKEQDAIIGNTTFTPEQIEQAKILKGVYQNDLKAISEQENAIDKTNPEQVGYLLNKSGFINAMSTMYSGRTSTTYEKNDVYYADQDLAIKLENLEIEKQKLALQQAKEGKVKADGTIDYSGTMSQAVLTNQEVPEADFYTEAVNLYNENYNAIIGKGSEVYLDLKTTDADRQLFKSSLERNGYTIDSSGNVTAKDKNIKVSKASAVAQAFKEANLDKVYPEVDKEISLAEERRRQLSRGINEANKEFSKDFNTDLLTDQLEWARKVLLNEGFAGTVAFVGRLGDLTETGARLAEPFTGEDPYDTTRKNLGANIQKFIKDNGGIDKLKEKMRVNPTLAQQVVNLMNDAAKADLMIAEWDYDGGKVTRDLNKAGAKIKNAGILPSVTSQYTVNLGSENMRAELVNMIPSNRYVDSALLDSKLPMTVRKISNDEIEITQAGGSKTNSKGEIISGMGARVVLTREDDAFRFLESNVDMKVQFKISATTTPSNYKVEPDAVPQFMSANSASDPAYEAYNEKYVRTINKNVDATLKQDIFKIAGVNIMPQSLVNKNNVRDFMLDGLSDKFSKEQIDALYNSFINNSKNYKFEVVNNRQKNWVKQITAPNKSTYFFEAVSSTPEIDSDYMYMVKDMPEINLVINLVAFLKKNPDKINNFISK